MNKEKNKFSIIDEDSWAMKAAELEDGCCVTAGSIDPEFFFREVEKNKKLFEHKEKTK